MNSSQTNPLKPPDSIFVVTGASSGIGRAVVKELAGRGLQVLAVARTASLLESLVDECGDAVNPLAADLATAPGVASIAEALSPDVEISGVVHAAGSLVPLQSYAEIDPGGLSHHFQVHVVAPIAVYKELSKHSLVKRMLFVDSYSANAPRQEWSAYSVVKSAAQMAARCAAQELPDTITIRVFPGAVNTQVVDAVLSSKTATARVFQTMLDNGEFAEPAETASFLVAILVDAEDDLLRERESWDFNEASDQAVVRRLGKTSHDDA